jgi:AraC family transcriptional regulator
VNSRLTHFDKLFIGGGEVRNFYLLTEAVNYIEDNICEEISCQMIADCCGVSLSSLQKLFRLAMHKSIKEYIRKRRISLAAEDVLKTDMCFIEIAYKYQFSSPEVFCRAFRKVWNESPSSYKEHWRFSGIFPKIDYHYEEGADQEMAREDNMLMFRIGGDEFALVSGLSDLQEAGKLAEKVLCRNGEKIVYKNQSIKLALRAGFTKVPEETLRYSEFFTNMHQSIEESK